MSCRAAGGGDDVGALPFVYGGGATLLALSNAAIGELHAHFGSHRPEPDGVESPQIRPRHPHERQG